MFRYTTTEDFDEKSTSVAQFGKYFFLQLKLLSNSLCLSVRQPVHNDTVCLKCFVGHLISVENFICSAAIIDRQLNIL